jgi:hypothetical protein
MRGSRQTRWWGFGHGSEVENGRTAEGALQAGRVTPASNPGHGER